MEKRRNIKESLKKLRRVLREDVMKKFLDNREGYIGDNDKIALKNSIKIICLNYLFFMEITIYTKI